MERIIAELKALRAEVAELKADLAAANDKTHKNFMHIYKCVTAGNDILGGHLDNLFRQVRRIDQQLDPILLQVFPTSDELRAEIDAATKL